MRWLRLQVRWLEYKKRRIIKKAWPYELKE
jgi:hypothetical protein